nr:hypothetical protein BaRGS_008309 [Batillaria attramentaria]
MKIWSQDVTFDDVVVTDFTYFMTGVADREECAYHCATATTCASFFYAESEGRIAIVVNIMFIIAIVVVVIMFVLIIAIVVVIILIIATVVVIISTVVITLVRIIAIVVVILIIAIVIIFSIAIAVDIILIIAIVVIVMIAIVVVIIIIVVVMLVLIIAAAVILIIAIVVILGIAIVVVIILIYRHCRHYQPHPHYRHRRRHDRSSSSLLILMIAFLVITMIIVVNMLVSSTKLAREICSKCPVGEGYIQASGLHFCYKIHQLRKVSRETASAICLLEEATLVNVDSEEKVQELQHTLRHNYVCPSKDWVQFRNSCYQFFPDRLGQASGVGRECRDLEARAYGVGIETLEEDTFLQAYLQQCCPGVPTYYPTLILVWHNASLTYKWKGEWAYSAYQWPGGAYPYICERKAQVCPTKDWVKFRDSCYQFFPRGREQYAGTFKQCRKIGACAVGIQTAEEDAFLQAYIQRCCSGVPTYYPTLVLVWHNSSRSYKWRGDWHYSVYQYPAGAYPFICERKAETSNAMMKYTVQTPGGGCKALDGQRNFTLTDVPCDDKLDGFVCEKNA